MAFEVLAGQIILADHLNNLVPLFARKTSDQTLTQSSTTLQNVTDLVVTPAVSTNYLVEALFNYDTGTTPDIKFGVTYPTGATFTWDPAGLKFDGTDFQSHFTARYRQTSGANTAFAVAGLGAGTPVGVHVKGLLVMSTNTGTLQVQAAQNTSNASNTIVKADSWIRLTRLP